MQVRFAPKATVGLKKEPRQTGPPVGRASSAGLHRVVAAQPPITGLDCPTTPKVELALRSSVMTVTKECISTGVFVLVGQLSSKAVSAMRRRWCMTLLG